MHKVDLHVLTNGGLRIISWITKEKAKPGYDRLKPIIICSALSITSV